jgi:hypothetical protein
MVMAHLVNIYLLNSIFNKANCQRDFSNPKKLDKYNKINSISLFLVMRTQSAGILDPAEE